MRHKLWIMAACLCCAVQLFTGCDGADEWSSFSEAGEVLQSEGTTEDGSEAADDSEKLQAEPDQGFGESADAEQDTPSRIVVYICGAVVHPDVYELAADSRIKDAVDAAGGFTDEASETTVNLAARLSDGEMVRIYTLEEAQSMAGSSVEAWEAENGLININRADVRALCELPGIGESRARDIVAYREKNGAFRKKEDIMKVTGIKESLYRKIKDLISVE